MTKNKRFNRFSACLHPDMYREFTEHEKVEQVTSEVTIFRYEHEHRKWEYGIALAFLKDIKAKTVLDVGGGGSIFAPFLAKNGLQVTELDLSNQFEAVRNQNKALNLDMKVIHADWLTYAGTEHYDAIACISTIEHIKEWDDVLKFYDKLLDYGDAVFLTTDFFPTRERFSGNHWRTFNQEDMLNFVALAKDKGFEVVGETDWEYKGNFVYQYTFASLGLKRI